MLVQTSAVIAMMAAMAGPIQFTDYQDALEACDGNAECAQAMTEHTNEFADPDGNPNDPSYTGDQVGGLEGMQAPTTPEVTFVVTGSPLTDGQTVVVDYECVEADLAYVDAASVRTPLNTPVMLPLSTTSEDWSCQVDIAGESVRAAGYEASWTQGLVLGPSVTYGELGVTWTPVATPDEPEVAEPEVTPSPTPPATPSEDEGATPAPTTEATEGGGANPFGLGSDGQSSQDYSSGQGSTSTTPFASEEEAVDARVSSLSSPTTSSDPTTGTQAGSLASTGTRVLGWIFIAAMTLSCGAMILRTTTRKEN